MSTRVDDRIAGGPPAEWGPVDRLLMKSEVEARTGLSTSSIYRGMRAGTFPEPFRVGVRAVRWRQSEIEQWLASLPRASGDLD